MTRLAVILVLGSAGLLFTPTSASAQFGRPVGPGFPAPGINAPFFRPTLNPYQYVPRYQYQTFSQFSVQTSIGGFSLSSRQYAYGIGYPSVGWGVYQASPIAYAQGGLTYGGTSVRPNLMYQAQHDLASAQRAMSAGGSQYQPPRENNPDKPVAVAKVESGPVEVPMKALAVADPARIASGEALNELLKEIVKVESKSGIRPSGFIPSMLLDDMRFAGSDAADAINLVRQGTHLDFPSAFDDASLKESRVALAQDFAVVAAAVQAGKAPDAAKLAKAQQALQRFQDASEPILKNLAKAEATAARGFLNQTANTLKALKGTEANGLVDPKWSVEGTTVADLVKHMTRHKLQFGPAPAGNEDSYSTMHRNLATYLFLLTQPKR